MRVALLSSLVAFTVTTTAILVTYPPKGEKIDWSKPVTIKWDSVETDPATFDLYLVNQAVNPSVSTLVASDVDASKGSYTIKANNRDLTASDTGGGYQIDLKASSGDGILAQSQQFKWIFVYLCFGDFFFHAFHFPGGIDYCQYYCFDVCFLDFFVDCFFLFSDYYSLLHHCVYPHHCFFIYYYIHFCFYLYFIFYDDFFYQCVYPKFLFFVYPFYRTKIHFDSFNTQYFFLEFYLEYIHIIKNYPFQHYYKDSLFYFFSPYIKINIYFYIVHLYFHLPFYYDYPYQNTILHFLHKHQDNFYIHFHFHKDDHVHYSAYQDNGNYLYRFGIYHLQCCWFAHPS
ncbi:UPF0619 GPI-anchored membrane protein [Penicillium subrubescens]|uniref:UPF0619 GPI-anchored membrane protein n=1 Tax=Penicillium subrubescens TaxID=1316194 RepID=UPI002545B8A2|nr:UPF0619 GPI-anchored membrane protein [Penicillium subrubescens]KAJ5906082.1 UPF0619 GPI-anchored membrane protein [Penicillium subrubescens]